jgi:hypothetical protein
VTDEDIDTLLAKGEEATKDMNAKMSQYTNQALQFQMDGGGALDEYAEPEEETGADFMDPETLKVSELGFGSLVKHGSCARETKRTWAAHTPVL